ACRDRLPRRRRLHHRPAVAPIHQKQRDSVSGEHDQHRPRDQPGCGPAAGLPRPRPPGRPPSRGVAREADVSRLAAWVATRGEGERNRGLFWAACRLAESGVPASDGLDVLSAAAAEAGLGEREIATTVRSAYRTAAPGTRESSSAVRGSSPLAADGWFAQDTTRQSPSRVREL